MAPYDPETVVARRRRAGPTACAASSGCARTTRRPRVRRPAQVLLVRDGARTTHDGHAHAPFADGAARQARRRRHPRGRRRADARRGAGRARALPPLGAGRVLRRRRRRLRGRSTTTARALGVVERDASGTARRTSMIVASGADGARAPHPARAGVRRDVDVPAARSSVSWDGTMTMTDDDADERRAAITFELVTLFPEMFDGLLGATPARQGDRRGPRRRSPHQPARLRARPPPPGRRHALRRRARA